MPSTLPILKQYKRSDTDLIKLVAPEVLLQANQGIELQTSAATNTIIPTLLKIDVHHRISLFHCTMGSN